MVLTFATTVAAMFIYFLASTVYYGSLWVIKRPNAKQNTVAFGRLSRQTREATRKSFIVAYTLSVFICVCVIFGSPDYVKLYNRVFSFALFCLSIGVVASDHHVVFYRTYYDEGENFQLTTKHYFLTLKTTFISFFLLALCLFPLAMDEYQAF